MVPEIKRILYATDLSENARYAFSYAASLADRYDAQMTVLHVLEDVSTTFNMHISGYVGADEWARLQAEKEETLLNTIAERLNAFCSEAKERMEQCKFIVEKILVVKGVPALEILNQAEAGDADMIVIGTHGYGVFKDALMGGTARRVVRRSPVPVMVVRLPEND
ncbi:MAG: universal stress protein [Desulfosarcinaceae bacterium]|jgi:nucleotide-binding universal stress UspA family protein